MPPHDDPNTVNPRRLGRDKKQQEEGSTPVREVGQAAKARHHSSVDQEADLNPGGGRAGVLRSTTQPMKNKVMRNPDNHGRDLDRFRGHDRGPGSDHMPPQLTTRNRHRSHQPLPFPPNP